VKRPEKDWVKIVEFQDALLAHGEQVTELLASDCEWCNGLGRFAVALGDWDTATFRRVYRKYVQATRG